MFDFCHLAGRCRALLMACVYLLLLSACEAPSVVAPQTTSPLVTQQSHDDAALQQLLDLIEFATWCRTAPVEELQRVRQRLEKNSQGGDDESSLRLALLLDEPRTPQADSVRARELLARYLSDRAAERPTPLVNFAALLLRNWTVRAAQGELIAATQTKARKAHQALLAEGKRRALAETRLEALIKLEKRVKTNAGAISQLKPSGQ